MPFFFYWIGSPNLIAPIVRHWTIIIHRVTLYSTTVFTFNSSTNDFGFSSNPTYDQSLHRFLHNQHISIEPLWFLHTLNIATFVGVPEELIVLRGANREKLEGVREKNAEREEVLRSEHTGYET